MARSTATNWENPTATRTGCCSGRMKASLMARSTATRTGCGWENPTATRTGCSSGCCWARSTESSTATPMVIAKAMKLDLCSGLTKDSTTGLTTVKDLDWRSARWNLERPR